MQIKIIYILLLFNFLVQSQNTYLNTFITDASIPKIGKRVYVDNPSAELAQSGTTQWYVTANGSGSTCSAGSPCSFSYALSNATAGTTVWVKAGAYNDSNGVVQSNDGTVTNAIKFIGYKNTIGDIITDKMSSFLRTDINTEPSTTELPILIGDNTDQSIGFNILGDYVSFQNFGIQNYYYNLFDNGIKCHYKNIVSKESVKGIHLKNETDGGVFENFFNLNHGSEAMNVKGNSYLIRNGVIWTDDVNLPGDIEVGKKLLGYGALTGTEASNNVWEGITIYRIPDRASDYHHMHALVCKQDATNNIYRNSVVINTGIEVNYTGVYNNHFENIEIYGSHSTNPATFTGEMIRVLNGAHDNTFTNIYLEDVQFGFDFYNWEDGLPDTATGIDAEKGGDNNTFTNIIVNGATRVWNSTDAQDNSADNGTGTSNGNTIIDGTFYNINDQLFRDAQTVTNTQWINCNFDNISNAAIWSNSNSVSFGHTFENCNFINKSFSNPSGTSITSLNSNFVNAGSNISGFQLTSASPLKGIGKNSMDLGFQFQSNTSIISILSKRKESGNAIQIAN